MATRDQPGNSWALVLHRQPARMMEGRPEGGYTDMFEVICPGCGCGCGCVKDFPSGTDVLWYRKRLKDRAGRH